MLAYRHSGFSVDAGLYPAQGADGDGQQEAQLKPDWGEATRRPVLLSALAERGFWGWSPGQPDAGACGDAILHTGGLQLPDLAPNAVSAAVISA